MKITPFGNNILVVPTKKKQVLVSDANAITAYGEVIDVGKEVLSIKIGDVIGFTKWGIRELDIDGEKHYFVPESCDFILGTLHD